MSWVAAAIGGGALIGAGASIYASNKQSDAAAAASANSLAMYNQSRNDLAPYREVGGNALQTLAQIYGIPGGGSNATQPFSQSSIDAFLKSPDYLFAQQQGTRALDFSNAAKGLLKSGAHLKDLTTFNQGLATQQFGNYVNRLLALTNFGANAATGSATNNLAFAGQQGQNLMAQGQAEASGVVGAANSISGGLSSYANNLHLSNLINSGRVGGTTPVGAPMNIGPYAGAATPGWGGTPGMY